jgi:signal transduction histidine kinase
LTATLPPKPELSEPVPATIGAPADLAVALLTPTGADADVAERVLEGDGFEVKACRSMEEICELVTEGAAGVLLLAEEALDQQSRMKLFDSLNRQPSWSDIPIVLLTGEDELSDALPRTLSGVAVKGNVTLLERPVRVATLTTVIRSAQRARQRQLDVRNLVESERAARRQAEEANSAKSQFLATMSHELRTPLNAIAGYTQLLSLGVRGELNEDQRADLERIDRSQRHLLSLINDILNFAKIEAGHVSVDHIPVDVCVVLDTLEELIRPQLREKQLAFSVTHPEEGATAVGDADKVRQILLNLLSNAIKFTPPGGRIDVACIVKEWEVDITVSDTGVGIPADKIDAVFEPFVQVGRDFNTSHGGTGLGLSISRDLARRMGGDLTLESRLGKGSVFTLSLVRFRPSPPESDPVDDSAAGD